MNLVTSTCLTFWISLFLVVSGSGSIVINEVHYDPEIETEPVEFIEITNTGSVAVDLSGSSFRDGVELLFPPGTILDAGSYLLVAEDPAALDAKYSIPPGTSVIAYSKSLSNSSDKINLIDISGAIIDQVDYRSSFPWPVSPSGGGNSMQLLHPGLDNNLGGAWRGAAPTPGLVNLVFTDQVPPIIRQVSHTPQIPNSATATAISAKVTDSDGVASVTLLYQTVAPGSYIPAFLPKSYATLIDSPETPLQPNPAFEDSANWQSITMLDDGTQGDLLAGDDIYTAVIPAQINRTLVRYRISAQDTQAVSLRVPHADDGSLNFAYFVYDGVPAFTASSASVHPDGVGHVYPASMLTTLPVYTMITRDIDRRNAFAYSSTGDGGWQIPKGHAARGVYNWECSLVYDGVVYDHVGWRLRQNNDRYTGNGKRSMRYRFNQGYYFQAHDEAGKILPVKWKRMNTSKMSRFEGTNSFGFHQTMNSKLWRMVGVECPLFLPAHFRMIDGSDEAPNQYGGDFFGLATVVQDIDGRLLDDRDLPNGNIYKLKDAESDPLELQRNQGSGAVTDGSDFLNIKNNLNATQTNGWLRDHVDWDQWVRYHAVVEAVRHYDYGTTVNHRKNRAWYFKPELGTPYGLLRVIPHDHDASWLAGYHDSLNSQGTGIGTGYPWSSIFGGIVRPPAGPEKQDFTRDYRNFIREFRDILWQEETVNAMIDDHAALLEAFSLADRDRWSGGPAAAGVETMIPIEDIATSMKDIAFVNDTVYGASLLGGRGAFLDQIAEDALIPATPSISYSGDVSFSAGRLSFTSSDFEDPQGAGSFGKMAWRIAEVKGVSSVEPVNLISSGDMWKYFDAGTDPGATWMLAGYADGTWGSGATQMGYGESNQATTLSGGHATNYFRKVITLSDPTLFSSYDAGVVRDDAAIVYVNGVEVWRNQMPAGAVDYTTLASERASSGSNETDFQAFTIPAGVFVAGDNIIAVEIHQIDVLSGDMRFDMQLIGNLAPPVQSIERVYEWLATWESGELPSFQKSITPPAVATRAGNTYRARVRHQDTTGRWSHWSPAFEFTATQPDISLYTDAIVVSEIMYHPVDPTPVEIAAGYVDNGDFEYIEIRNVSSQTLDLKDVRFTKGIDFDFSAGTITTLAPGEFALVVEDEDAFAMRYGSEKPVAGKWSGKLSNAGEQVKLSFGAGETIRDFIYDDLPNWPTSPDGLGTSLVLAHPLSLPDHSDPFSWRASIADHGTPGGTDGSTFPGGTSNDLLAYALGASGFTVLPDGNVTYSVEINQLADDVAGEPEASEDLLIWNPITSVLGQSTPERLPGGMLLRTWSTLIPPSQKRLFFRYHLR